MNIIKIDIIKKILEFIFFIVYNVIPAGKEISNYKDKV